MKIALLGDIALYGKYSLDGNSGVRGYFERISAYLRGFDYVVANLETPFGTGYRPVGAKSAYISSDPQNVELLRHLNVNIVNLANNHVFDYGLDGYRCTLDSLERNEIAWFGVEGSQLELTTASAAVALHGYCSYNTNPLGITRRMGAAGINPLDVRVVEERMRSNHERGFLNIVSVHSGIEHVNYPSLDDISMARQFGHSCPYVYYGHHPHVMQGVEEFEGSLIAYSLGNFCFDDVYTSRSRLPLVKQTTNNRTGLIVALEVVGKDVVSHELTPIFAGDGKMEIDNEAARGDLIRYSEALELPRREYSQKRIALISAFVASRKQHRDLAWYVRRLNWNSVEMLIRAKYNQIQYKRHVSRYLD